jgi:5-(carboxyamino)imidazole ribonucleotide mutase
MENGPLVIILMGSASDRPHSNEIKQALEKFGLACQQHIASAHKNPARLLELVAGYENQAVPHVYITVAGRSNALSGMIDAAVRVPVIACPPPSQSFGGADLFSSLRMPSGVAPLVVLEPTNAALAAAKILALVDPAISEKIGVIQQANARLLEEADLALQSEV